MKHFIDLKTQIYPYSEKNTFAFFCTVTNTFEEFSEAQFWTSKESFIEDYDNENEDIQRYLDLIPDNWNISWSDVRIFLSGEEITGIKAITYIEDTIDSLKEDLFDAVANEKYELASKINNQINQLKSNLES